MNWYKFYKTAFPLVMEPRNTYYTEIGHPGYKKIQNLSSIFLWFIDVNWQIHVINAKELADKEGEDLPIHSRWDEFNSNSVLAQGRVDSSSGNSIASLVMEPDEFIGKRQMESAIHRVTAILDKTFNNPEIQSFY